MNRDRGAAHILAPAFCAVLGVRELPVRLVLWDGSQAGPSDGPTIVMRSRRALRRMLWAPNELGLGRAYVSGDLDIQGDVFDVVNALSVAPRLLADAPLTWREKAAILGTALRLGAIGPNPPAPPEEVKLTGDKHGHQRDQRAISHHYDVGNEFYRLVLGPTMVYSCAYFETPEMGLDEAQTAKLDMVAKKLDLQPGQRLLDVGCGWGSMAIHAAANYGVHVVGITLSKEQAELAEKRVAEAGLTDLVEIRIQDYRDIADGPYDAISSIGMSEHVGTANMPAYAHQLHDVLRPGGRLLNHAIAWLHREPRWDSDTFMTRFVFPDGELQTVGTTVNVLERAGLEVIGVHALRPNYVRTLHAWEERLERNWSEAARLTSEGRTRVWRLYMAWAATSFENATLGVNQVLAVRPTEMPHRD